MDEMEGCIWMNGWIDGGGWGWHLLSGDQTAALKHAELISIVAANLSYLSYG